MISFLTTAKSSESITKVFDAKKTGREEIDSGESFNIIPVTKSGQMSLIILFLGLLIFFCGIFMGSQGLNFSSHIAVLGMIIFFIGGWFRTLFS
jgi:hypothetical protein